MDDRNTSSRIAETTQKVQCIDQTGVIQSLKDSEKEKGEDGKGRTMDLTRLSKTSVETGYVTFAAKYLI